MDWRKMRVATILMWEDRVLSVSEAIKLAGRTGPTIYRADNGHQDTQATLYLVNSVCRHFIDIKGVGENHELFDLRRNDRYCASEAYYAVCPDSHNSNDNCTGGSFRWMTPKRGCRQYLPFLTGSTPCYSPPHPPSDQIATCRGGMLRKKRSSRAIWGRH